MRSRDDNRRMTPEEMMAAAQILKENPDAVKSFAWLAALVLIMPMAIGGVGMFIIMLVNGVIPMVFGWLAGVFVLVLLMLPMYNKAMRLRMAVKGAYSQLDNDFQRRAELIPNLVEIVKDAMGYEVETLSKLVEQRQQGTKAMAEKVRVEDAVSKGIQTVMTNMEAYPTLQANANMATLKSELAETETRIAAKRDQISSSVQAYNSYICSLPAAWILPLMGFKEMEQIGLGDNEAARQAVKVDLR